MSTEPRPHSSRLAPELGGASDWLTPHSVEAVRTAAPPVEWQHLWFAIARQSWTALAIVPAHPLLSSLNTARQLVAAGQALGGSRLVCVDATSPEPAAARLSVAEVERHVQAGSQCVVAVASPITKPASIGVVRAAGAAVLLVPLGDTAIATAQRTIECIGREHFLGAISTRHRS